MDTENPALTDDEIVAELLQLARSGRYLRLRPLLEEVKRAHPQEPAERIDACARKLAELLWERDYMGFATEYRARGLNKLSSTAARAESRH